MHDLPWTLMGDFNILREGNDTTSINPNLHSMIDFNLLILDLQLQELPLIGRTYTCSNKRPQPSFSKLDRVFLSQHRTISPLTFHTSQIYQQPRQTTRRSP
jgi:hypothetical protein